MSLSEKPDAAIKSVEIEKSEPLNNNNIKHLQNELKMFEVTGEKTKNIRFLIDTLKTVTTNVHRVRKCVLCSRTFHNKLKDKTQWPQHRSSFIFEITLYKYCLVIIIV